MVDHRILPNGDLEFTADGDVDARDAYELLDESGLMGNGWDVVMPAGALTSAPIIADDAIDATTHMEPTPGARVWWFPDYQVEDPIETLRTTGRVVFARVEVEEPTEDAPPQPRWRRANPTRGAVLTAWPDPHGGFMLQWEFADQSPPPIWSLFGKYGGGGPGATTSTPGAGGSNLILDAGITSPMIG